MIRIGVRVVFEPEAKEEVSQAQTGLARNQIPSLPMTLCTEELTILRVLPACSCNSAAFAFLATTSDAEASLLDVAEIGMAMNGAYCGRAKTFRTSRRLENGNGLCPI
jgi:hypothetical protein